MLDRGGRFGFGLLGAVGKEETKVSKQAEFKRGREALTLVRQGREKLVQAFVAFEDLAGQTAIDAIDDFESRLVKHLQGLRVELDEQKA